MPRRETLKKLHVPAVFLLACVGSTFACGSTSHSPDSVDPEGGSSPTGTSGKASSAGKSSAQTGGSAAEGGSTTSAGGSAAMTDGGVTTSGGADEQGGDSAGGVINPPVDPMCQLMPDTTTPAVGDLDTTVLWARLQRFLNDVADALPPPNFPTRISVAVAQGLAMQILDAHVTSKTEAPGLVRFLKGWLQLPGVADPKAAHIWALKLAAGDATLATLLSESNGDPKRLGILTDQEVLAARNNIARRGNWMNESILCVEVPPLPLIGSPPPNPVGVTRREKYESTLSSKSCTSCHVILDPPGDSLEHFDEAGNYRELDGGEAVDSSGTLTPSMLKFHSFDDLAPQLATSCAVARCLSKLVMTDANPTSTPAKLPFTDAEVNHVANELASSGFSIRALVKAVVATPSFTH
jgi:hypothetical protein